MFRSLCLLSAFVVAPVIEELSDDTDIVSTEVDIQPMIDEADALVAKIDKDRYASPLMGRHTASLSLDIAKSQTKRSVDTSDDLDAKRLRKLDAQRDEYVPVTDSAIQRRADIRKYMRLSDLRSRVFDMLTRKERAGESFFSMDDKKNLLQLGVEDEALLRSINKYARLQSTPQIAQACKIARVIMASVPYDNPDCFLFARSDIGKKLQEGLAIFQRNVDAIERAKLTAFTLKLATSVHLADGHVVEFADDESFQRLKAIAESV